MPPAAAAGDFCAGDGFFALAVAAFAAAGDLVDFFLPPAAAAGDFFAGDGFLVLDEAGDFLVALAGGDFLLRFDVRVGVGSLLGGVRFTCLMRAIFKNCVNSDKPICQNSYDNY